MASHANPESTQATSTIRTPIKDDAEIPLDRRLHQPPFSGQLFHSNLLFIGNKKGSGKHRKRKQISYIASVPAILTKLPPYFVHILSILSNGRCIWPLRFHKTFFDIYSIHANERVLFMRSTGKSALLLRGCTYIQIELPLYMVFDPLPTYFLCVCETVCALTVDSTPARNILRVHCT